MTKFTTLAISGCSMTFNKANFCDNIGLDGLNESKGLSGVQQTSNATARCDRCSSDVWSVDLLAGALHDYMRCGAVKMPCSKLLYRRTV